MRSPAARRKDLRVPVHQLALHAHHEIFLVGLERPKPGRERLHRRRVPTARALVAQQEEPAVVVEGAQKRRPLACGGPVRGYRQPSRVRCSCHGGTVELANSHW
jgi:hypothetical protein